jgi:hypothetical protein
MTGNHWVRLGAALTVAALFGCAKGEQAQSSADSTARNLTLAPTDSTAAMKDVPVPTSAPAAPAKAPASKPAPKPAAPTSFTIGVGTAFAVLAGDSITTRSAKAGDAFSGTVSQDVRDAAGHVVIPAGAMASGTIVHADPAPNPRASGHLEISVTSVTVRGRSYSVDATVDYKDTVMQGRGVTTADAAKVGGGAVIGAIAGKIVGKNAKGAAIGAVLGAAGGAAAARRSRDIDVVLPKGAGIHLRLARPLTVSAH